MIPGLDKDQFAATLHKQLSPTTPIQSQEHLRGREAQMREIEQALYAPGRSIFIHGERGVGKTSLAQTVAHQHQSSDYEPIILACQPQSTFAGIMSELISRFEVKKGQSTISGSAKFGVKGFGVELSGKREPQPRPEIDLDLNTAVQGLQQAAERRGGTTVAVIDEFDRISSEPERAHFADLIKQIGDQQIGVRFIFCGVADSLDKLLGAHESCYRYLAGVAVPRLPWEARWEIIDAAAAAFGITVSDHPRFRIAAISDGFPHYIHLVSEMLFWEMFNDEQVRTTPTKANYQAAVAAAVQGIEQHLKRTYDKATIRGEGEYEHILWAVADHGDLIRNTNSIYQSYTGLAANIEADPLDRNVVVNRLSTLKTESCGRILVSERRGFYQYREGMMRGYVRLRAEERGIELETDYASGPASKTVWRQRGARRSFQWRPPDDIYES